MDELELIVQRHVINFCKILPVHVEKWRTILVDLVKPSSALCNYSEQVRHIERCNIKYIDGFSALQQDLLYKIFTEIEDEMSSINGLREQLNKINQDTRNKLSVLERSSIDLNWDNNSQLIVGSALQPPLSRILQDGYNFCLFFSEAIQSINEHCKTLNIRDEKLMNAFKDSLSISLEVPVITNLLAVTQYVNNEKLLV
ncbi:hypothetical protein NQ318_016287 [Aromia moschata]|uniref:Uncharacterized protein n=1 Tax=Aromia moschata TaxID=1265417 RepID=A0AAV8XZ02_9CUCU|nr:hypothetical protein NQ318_016287 [Aromia moschata]